MIDLGFGRIGVEVHGPVVKRIAFAKGRDEGKGPMLLSRKMLPGSKIERRMTRFYFLTHGDACRFTIIEWKRKAKREKLRASQVGQEDKRDLKRKVNQLDHGYGLVSSAVVSAAWQSAVAAAAHGIVGMCGCYIVTKGARRGEADVATMGRSAPKKHKQEV